MIVLNPDAQQRLELSIPSGSDIAVWRLEASDLTATSGVTLAGAQISPGKPWQPQREERFVSKNREVHLRLEPGSGAALFLRGA